MRVILESPLAGEVDRNIVYARRALKDSLDRGEFPFASHLLYPQVLDDTIVTDRAKGIAGQLAWIETAQAVVVYQDYGVSPGMKAGLKQAKKLGKFIAYRNIGMNPNG